MSQQGEAGALVEKKERKKRSQRLSWTQSKCFLPPDQHGSGSLLLLFRRANIQQQRLLAGQQKLQAYPVGIWGFTPSQLQPNNEPNAHDHGPGFGHKQPSATQVAWLAAVFKKEQVQS